MLQKSIHIHTHTPTHIPIPVFPGHTFFPWINPFLMKTSILLTWHRLGHCQAVSIISLPKPSRGGAHKYKPRLHSQLAAQHNKYMPAWRQACLHAEDDDLASKKKYLVPTTFHKTRPNHPNPQLHTISLKISLLSMNTSQTPKISIKHCSRKPS